MPPTIAQLTEGIPSLGSYGAVINEIEAILDNPSSTLADVGAVIEKDPALAARLLRLGNSAFYGFAHRLETVAEAISLIGIQQVQDLILASSVIDVFEGISAEQVNMAGFWKHSLACGIAARCLAIARQVPGAEKFFVAGLLHDLGRLVLLSQASQEANRVFSLYRSRRILLWEAERATLGFDHAQIGQQLLVCWQFPPNLVQAVTWHHQPLGAGVFQLESSIVHLADYLVHAMQMGSSGELFVPPVNLKAWERVGLATDMIESVIKSVDDQIEAVENSFLHSRTAG